MPLTMEINDLSNKELAERFLNDMVNGQITTKQLVRNFKIPPKYAHYLLKTHPSTMLGKPREFSSNKFISLINGYKVYREYMNFGAIKSLYYLTLLSINSLKK